jgi:hypothetical protein
MWIEGLSVKYNFDYVQALTSDGKFSGGTLSDPSLTINNIAKSDEGIYACIAKHCFGTTSRPSTTSVFVEVIWIEGLSVK